MNPLALMTGVSTVVDAARSLSQAVHKTRPASAEKSGAASFDKELDAAVAKLVKARDKDGDGVLSLAEFGGDKAGFAKLDANHDGLLSAQELKGVFASSGASASGAGSVAG